MDPVTHFLTGACLSRAGFNRTTALATLTMTLAAEAPDIDVIAGFWGPLVGFQHHRGITHTFVGVPFMSAAVLGVVWIMHRIWSRNQRRQTKGPIRWGMLYALAIVASLSHILLDFTNNYGVRPFFPFDPRWYSWDIIFIIEPVMLALLALALILPSIFGLVSTELGSKRPAFRGRGLAIGALVLIAAFWLVRDVQHRTALRMLSSRDYDTGVAKRVGAMPYPINPFRWYAVVETDSAYETFDVHPNSLQIDPYGPQGTFFKPPETAVSLAAKKSWAGRVYLDWARFPIIETVPNESGWSVYFRDARYFYAPVPSRDDRQIRSTLGAHVDLDKQLNVVGLWMGRREQN
jgi:inner membrane protein